jgi:hypothetical protein
MDWRFNKVGKLTKAGALNIPIITEEEFMVLNKKSLTSIKDETTQRQHDQAAEWLYCRDQEFNKKKNNSAYLDSSYGIVHASTRIVP